METPAARRIPAVLAGLVLFGLSVASHIVCATYGADVAPPPPVQAADAPEADRSRIEVVEGIPVLHLSGTPYEMGRQHGAILAKQIRYLREQYCEPMIVRSVGAANLAKWADAVEEHIPKSYREELRGLADGAGLTYREVLLMNTMVDRFQAMMCSTIVAAGDATVDGEVYFGRNLDFPGRNVLHRTTIVIRYEPDDGEPLVAITWPGLIGVLSGMNAHGVCGATMMIHRGDELKPGTPYMILYRDALAHARKTADVPELIRKAKRTCPNNFMVVDPTGDALVVEWDQEHVATRPADRGCVCSTNHFRTEALRDIGFPLGMARYETLASFIEERRGRIDLDGVRAALRDVAKPWYLNVQSMVFLPGRRELHLSVGGKLPAAKQRFVHLTRARLFGRGGPEK